MNKTILTMVSLAMFFFFIAGNVSAALPPPGANFEFDFSQLNLPEGEWNLYLIPTNSYAAEDFNFFKEDYISTKQMCGTDEHDIWTRYNPSAQEIEEIKQHHPVVLIGDNGVFYKFFTDEESKEKYSKCFTYGGFRYYHDSKGIELKREYGKDISPFYPTTCEIKDNSCTFRIYEESNKKDFYVVLEKMDSTEDVYFSSPININWEAENNVKWTEFEDDVYTLSITQLDFSEPNNLLVSFTGSNPGDVPPVEPTPNEFPSVYYWIIGLVIVAVLIILFFSLRKKK